MSRFGFFGYPSVTATTFANLDCGVRQGRIRIAADANLKAVAASRAYVGELYPGPLGSLHPEADTCFPIR